MVRVVVTSAVLVGALATLSGPVHPSSARCTPWKKAWTARDTTERAVLAVATNRWRVFDLGELPFMGPYRPAGIDTIPFPSPDTTTDWWVVIDGDSVPVRQGVSAIYFRRRATPTSYRAQAFRTLRQGAGPGHSLAQDSSFWAIPYGYGPDCRRFPTDQAEWIPVGDTAVFVLRVNEQGLSSGGELVVRQPRWLGPYPHARPPWPLDLDQADPVRLYERLRSE